MPTPATIKNRPSTVSPAQRLARIILTLEAIAANRDFTDRQLGMLLTQIGGIDRQLGRCLLMPKKEVGCYFDVFETALMKLSVDNEPTIKDVREVLAVLKRFQSKMISIATTPTNDTNLVKAIAHVSKAIKKDVQRRTSPALDSDYSAVLDRLDAATRNLSDAKVNEEMKRAIKGLIGAARKLGEAL